MNKPFTPFFIQIMSAGDSGSNCLYGLTADGQVYRWSFIRTGEGGLSKAKWILLESEV